MRHESPHACLITHAACPFGKEHPRAMSFLTTLDEELSQMAKAGTLKRELVMKGPQGPVVEVEGKGEVIMLTSNNYLGLANHPAIIEAADKAERDYGYGMASVRFICGTQTIHHELEARIARF